MHLLSLPLLAMGLGLVAAQDVDLDDIPNECRSVCDPVVQLTARCDRENDDDGAEQRCLCTGDVGPASVPACEACVTPLRGQDNDVRDILVRCNFAASNQTNSSTSTSANGTTTTGGAPTGTLTSATNGPTTTNTDDDNTSAGSNPQQTNTASSDTATSTGAAAPTAVAWIPGSLIGMGLLALGL